VSEEVVRKLRITGGQRVLVVNGSAAQKDLLSGLPAEARLIEAGEADAVVLFAPNSSEL